jgi:TPR repeat protein
VRGLALLLAGCATASSSTPAKQTPAATTKKAEPHDLQAGCDAGRYADCVDLGNDYEDGKGVPKDLARAHALWQRACDGGNGVGCLNLGNHLRDGTGMPADVVRARAVRARLHARRGLGVQQPRQPLPQRARRADRPRVRVQVVLARVRPARSARL